MDDVLPTPEDVVTRTFTTTRFRQGYDMDEVDTHLDALVQVMRAHEQGARTDDLPHSSQASGIAFTLTRWRDGYDPEEVDAFLILVQLAIARLEAGDRRSDAAAPSAAASPEAASVGQAPVAPGTSDPTRLTSFDVSAAAFSVVTLGAAYDDDQVDDYLDRCLAAMRALEDGAQPDADAPTSVEVRSTRFAMASFEGGYATAEVDAFLQRIADALAARGR
ncbi:DivIVA domain-containing protein [Agrococcus jejuensis]|uniref:Cell wall synthesis protein Wag31 n=1 Tax=Agrococcus jejuensis TaxID=399736 RepID=A0A1G8BBN7_9MICO|nr:DivIVA domain-containing protein [Agrococcus jejuensis]SDH30627.1 DivIVA domain-containing protein [Agrococcus jejuensis]